MKAALILAVAALAQAQNLSGEPACATACLSSAIAAAGCDLSDQACQCGPTQKAIGDNAAPCLLKSCALSDLLLAQTVGAQLCSAFSATAAMTTTSAGTTTSSGTMTITTGPSSTTTSTAEEGSTVTETDTFSSGTVAGNSTVTFNSGTPTRSTASTTGTSSRSASSTGTNLAAAATPLAFGALAGLVGIVAAM